MHFKENIKKILRKLAKFVVAKPKLKKTCKIIIKFFPHITKPFVRFYHNNFSVSHYPCDGITSDELNRLSRDAEDLYVEIILLRKKLNKETRR